MSIKEPLTVVYSIKLTQSQRIKLARLGGPKWLREQINEAVVRDAQKKEVPHAPVC